MVSRAYVVFTLAGESCALRCADVREILHSPLLGHPPAMPPVLEGFLDFGGAAIPLLRLDVLMGLPPSPFSAYRHVLLLRMDEPLALLVDRVGDIARIADERRTPLDEAESFNGCVEAEIMGEGGAIHVLSLARLLTAEERIAVAAHRARAQERLSSFAEPA